MIDNIVMVKRNLSDTEIKQIVKKSRLQEQSVNGFKHYDNRLTKNFNGGFFIKIGIDNTLKINGSLHKYYSFLQNKTLTNYDSFTMQQAKEAVISLINSIGFTPENTTITFYEIGLNIIVSENPKLFFEAIHSIGNFENPKMFFINPKYKDGRMIVTEYHKDYRLYHKVYDKIFEMQDKRKVTPESLNIIRIETVHRRVERTMLIDFFKNDNLKQLQTKFFNEWDKISFEKDINAPNGTHTSKIDLAKNIIYNGKNTVLRKAHEQYKNGTLSLKKYYTIKKFIDNWETEKFNYVLKNKLIFTIWENLYNSEKEKLTLKPNFK
ncbi:hypothetical protein [Flavobacterium columnare]|uniref:hypothetical protein n=1 Tax=Flavobacterium columnare TaxID=996 RepID=UPI000D1B0EC8|nr:hypothetical protein [Flavobacterium columnare]PTD14378.1 hypothetical protein C6N29_07975 [Flavobacterium columnare]